VVWQSCFYTTLRYFLFQTFKLHWGNAKYTIMVCWFSWIYVSPTYMILAFLSGYKQCFSHWSGQLCSAWICNVGNLFLAGPNHRFENRHYYVLFSIGNMLTYTIPACYHCNIHLMHLQWEEVYITCLTTADWLQLSIAVTDGNERKNIFDLKEQKFSKKIAFKGFAWFLYVESKLM